MQRTTEVRNEVLADVSRERTELLGRHAGGRAAGGRRHGHQLQSPRPDREPAHCVAAELAATASPPLQQRQRRLIRRITNTTTTVPTPASDTSTGGFVTNATTFALASSARR